MYCPSHPAFPVSLAAHQAVAYLSVCVTFPGNH